MSEIEEQVKKIVIDHLGIEESKVTPESKFIDDLGADSLDTVELVMAFEEKFGIEIPDDAAETIQTVQNAFIIPTYYINHLTSMYQDLAQLLEYVFYECSYLWHGSHVVKKEIVCIYDNKNLVVSFVGNKDQTLATNK